MNKAVVKAVLGALAVALYLRFGTSYHLRNGCYCHLYNRSHPACNCQHKRYIFLI